MNRTALYWLNFSHRLTQTSTDILIISSIDLIEEKQSSLSRNINPAGKYPTVVIPAKAGIQKDTGCRIKSGMTGLAI